MRRRGVAGQDDGAADREATQAVQHFSLGRRIEMGGGFIQQQEWRILEESTGDRDPLRLTT